jgi:antitoxin (DNA-binding transcriptional repressor) of toxin-antitoxin stability system
MTKTINIDDVSIKTVIALIRNGDEIVLEENGSPVAKVIPFDQNLEREFLAWEAASDEDFLKLEKES